MFRIYVTRPNDEMDFSLEDMLLGTEDTNEMHFICNDAVDGIDEERIEVGKNYGYDVSYGLDLFTTMKNRVYELLKSEYRNVICVDNVSNWMMGIDENATSFEHMYTEQQIDELREMINVIVANCDKHDISLLCNETMLQYIIDTVNPQYYEIVE